MGGVVDDIVNPGGAITGIDPVKSATGFTGTGFQPKAGAQGASAGASSSGQSGPPPSSGQYMQQFSQQQGRPFAQFGQQLNQLASAPPSTAGIGNIQSPSAQNTAAAVTAASIQARQNPMQMQQAAQGPSQFWQSMWA
jgi:hypothetical protein